MASKARGGLSKREWEAANPGKTAPSDKKSSKKSSSSFKAAEKSGAELETEKNIKDYREKLLASLQPTDEETALGTQVSNVEQSRDTGIQAIREKPIEMAPILGQSRNIETRAALELGTLEDRLARLQETRSNSMNALSTALGFATDDLSGYRSERQYADTLALGERDYQTGLSQYADTQAMSERDFAEQVRQYNQNYSLEQQKENRLGEDSKSDDYEKTEKELYDAIDSWKAKMRAGTASWADAWSSIKRNYGLSTNTIDDLLGISYRDTYDG